MKRTTWVTGGLVVGVLGACSPSVTVSRDDAGAGTGGTSVAGTAGEGGGGATPGNGGSGPMGLGGSGAVGNEGGDDGLGGSFGSGPGGGGVGGDGLAGMGFAGSNSLAVCPPCTRRAPPDPPTSACPPATGAVRSATIGPAGGEISLEDTPSTMSVAFSVTVYPGSLEEPSELTLSEHRDPPPDELFDGSPIYSVLPLGLELENGGVVKLPWHFPSGLAIPPFAVYFAETLSGPWQRLADSYTNAGFSQATFARTGFFIAAVERPEHLSSCP